MAEGLFRFLDTNLDGTGNKNASVNGSVTPVEFGISPFVTAENDDVMLITRLIVHISSNRTNVQTDTYGNIAQLANGLLVQKRNAVTDAVTHDLLDGVPIKSNFEWSEFCYDVRGDNLGNGPFHLSVRWTFTTSGRPLVIERDQKFVVVVRDDLSSLLDHRFQVQGMRMEPLELAFHLQNQWNVYA